MVYSKTWNRRFWLLCGASLFTNIILAVFLDLAPDEAYYWEFSRRLDLSYYDHPPMVGYIIALFRIFAGDTVAAVRGFALISNFAITFILFYIGREFLSSARTGFFAALLFHLCPAGLAAGFIMTPDAPLLFFWALCLLTFLVILKNPEPILPWLAMGIFLGLGALSKYNMIFMVPAVAASILVFPERRKLLYTGRFWAMVMLAFAGTIPVLVWNANHDWISFRFQFAHGLTPGNRSTLYYIGEFLGGQMLTIGPSVFLLLSYLAVVQSYRSWKSRDENVFFISATILPALLLFAYSGHKAKVEANWPQMAYLGGFLLVAHWLVNSWTRKRALATLVPGALLAAFAFSHSLTLVFPLPAKADVSRRLHGWTEFSRIIREVDRETGNKLLFVGQGHAITALMGFYGGIEPARLAEVNMNKNFQSWDTRDKILNASAIIYVDDDDHSEARQRASFYNSVEHRVHEITSRGKLVKRINLGIFRDPKTPNNPPSANEN